MSLELFHRENRSSENPQNTYQQDRGQYEGKIQDI